MSKSKSWTRTATGSAHAQSKDFQEDSWMKELRLQTVEVDRSRWPQRIHQTPIWSPTERRPRSMRLH